MTDDLEADPPDCCCDMCYCRGCTPCLDRIALTQWFSGWRPPLWHENPVMELEWGRCQ